MLEKKTKSILLKIIILFLSFWLCFDNSPTEAESPKGLIREGLKFYDKGNYADALQRWKSASKAGSKEADFLLGFLYDGVLQNEKEALFFFTKAALSGHIQAQVNVGLKYEKGEGTNVNREQAIYWYSLAAFNQDNNAQFRLASLLQEEPGKAKESHFWFGKSAELGNPEAHLALATNFILGRGVEKNLILAHVSCNLATFLSRDIRSISRSIQLRTELETKMSTDQIKKAEQLSRKCIEKKFKECMTYAVGNR
ncbi:sel1 repeat family protein [Paracoccaceae bacterium]|nr:sel1 repeat family protein [Paracoccaceae bacterium]